MTRPARAQSLGAILDRRRARGLAQDFTEGGGERSLRDGGGAEPFTSPTRSLLGILVGLGVIGGAVLAVVALPPVLECRTRADQGFFSGQTYSGCVGNGIAARRALLEERVKMILLRSGR